MKKIIMMFVLFCAVLSCDKNDDNNYQYKKPNATASEFTDTRDGYTYKCITVNGQTWMAENYRYLPKGASFFGVYSYQQEPPSLSDLSVLIVKSALTSAAVKKDIPADILAEMLNRFTYDAALPMDVMTEFYDYIPEAFYKNKNVAELVAPFDGDYYDTYGTLYTLEAAKKFAPEGWRLPTDEDWIVLEKSLGMRGDDAETFEDWRGDGLARGLKEGEDGIGFNALYAGAKLPISNGYGTPFYNLGSTAYFWTSSVYDKSDFERFAITRSVYNKNDAILRGTSIIAKVAYSVRYIKMTEEELSNEQTNLK